MRSQAATRIPTPLRATGRAPHTVREGWLGSSSETYEYDVYGNMTTYNGTPIPIAETGGVPNNRLAAGSYNDRGSLTSHDGFTFVWDALDQMRGMTSSTLHRSFAYDAAGERVFIREDAQDRFTLRGLDAKLLREIRRSLGQLTWEKDLVWRGGVLLATVGAEEGITHVHVDHLGSTRLLTDRCGQAVATFDLYPFGKTLGDSPQHPQRMRFTGHERDLNARNDDTDDFDYMHARYYSALLARFVSVDPNGGRPEAAQSWNRFAYALARPLVAVDADGREVTLLVGGPNDNWVVGHVAIAINGTAYSAFTTNTSRELHDWGVDASKYLSVESQTRQTVVATLNATPEQERALKAYLEAHNPRTQNTAWSPANNCATVTQDALVAVGILKTGVKGAATVQSNTALAGSLVSSAATLATLAPTITPGQVLASAYLQGQVTKIETIGQRKVSWWRSFWNTLTNAFRNPPS